MVKKINERPLLLVTTILLYPLLIWLVVKPLLGSLFFNPTEKGLLSATSYDSGNATYHFLLGRFYQYNSEAPDLRSAIKSYNESIKLSPLQGGCWLDLSKAYQTSGLLKDANMAMERTIRLTSKNPVAIWEAGIFFLINGNTEMAIRTFREFILLKPDKQEDVYDMVWKLPLDSHYIYANLVPPSYPYYRRYLLYLMSTDKLQEAKDLWKNMEGLAIEDALFIRYIDFLISGHLYDDAEKVWKDFISLRLKNKKEELPSLPWNGSFEVDIVNGGFDWKINETEGVDVFLDTGVHLLGGRSLGLTFDGAHNPDITAASQVVRVVPKSRYTLRGYIKTDSITTTNGIFLSVEGHDCKSLYKKSDVVSGTNMWKEVDVEFETPPECSVISIMIRRERSYKLDNKISGTAWIDGIILTRR